MGVHQGLFLDVGQTRRHDPDPATRQDEGGHGPGEALATVDALESPPKELRDPSGVHPWPLGGFRGRGVRGGGLAGAVCPASAEGQ